MKQIEIDDRSFLWRFLTFNYAFKLDKRSVNFCGLFWLGVFNMIVIAIGETFVVGTIFVAASMYFDLGAPAIGFDLMSVTTILGIFGVMGIFFTTMAGLVIGTLLLIVTILDWLIRKLLPGTKKINIIPENAKIAYDGWKHDYCPLVKVVGQAERREREGAE